MNIAVTLLLTFVVVVLTIAMMSVGVIAGRKPIKGSCGGLNGKSCEICTGRRCQRRTNQED